MWVSMRLGSLMLCSCACQAAFLTNPFDRCKPTRAMSLWQVNDLLLLLPRSELVTLNEHTDGPGDNLVGRRRSGLHGHGRVLAFGLRAGCVGSA